MSVMVHWWRGCGLFWDLDDITPGPNAIVRKTPRDSNHGQWGMFAKILLATGAMAGLRIVRFGGFGGCRNMTSLKELAPWVCDDG